MANQNIQYDVDIAAVERLLHELRLNTNESRRAIRSGLAQSGRIIRNKARQNLSRIYCKEGKIESKPLRRFVRSGVFKDLGGTVISISGNHKRRYAESLARKGIKDLAFTLKFFEEGTAPRYNKQKKLNWVFTRRLKKPRYTGYIEASHFFSQAVTDKKAEAQKLLQSFIEKHIRRIAMKNQSR